MTMDADQIVDRRRLRRKLSFWRVVAFLFAAVAIIGIIIAATPDTLIGPSRNHVARVTLNGVIVEDRRLEQMLARIAKTSSAKALIVSINSPGGTTAGSEAVYEAIRKVADKKPVVAQIGTVAASGGYAAAIAADHIVARRTSITGSIGVLFQWADIHGLLTDIGVEYETVKSGPLKAEPNPFQPTPEAARDAVRATVMDSYDWFVGLVADRRDMKPGEARKLADGRIYSGGQALDLKLVDALGGEDTAREWLAKEHGVRRSLSVREWKPERSLRNVGLGETAAWLARSAGFDFIARLLEAGAGRGIGGLDGLVSVWQPQDVEK